MHVLEVKTQHGQLVPGAEVELLVAAAPAGKGGGQDSRDVGLEVGPIGVPFGACVQGGADPVEGRERGQTPQRSREEPPVGEQLPARGFTPGPAP